MYTAHPSQTLNALFGPKPYQGADPLQSEFLFVGLDANYAADIEQSSAFEAAKQYHEDGVGFWRRHGVHHPFLLPSYTGDGRKYHRNFARIGFMPEHAPLVSFIELLHVPTVGRNTLTVSDLKLHHLQYVNAAITSGQARHVFLSDGVARLMRKSGAFPWLGDATLSDGPLPIFYADGVRTVYKHLHFSNYGKFEARMHTKAQAIAALLPSAG
ncbi:MAG: hypothetical protein U1D36_13100 [Hydrogenophaga sp.]|uniref:hypothetical protein n=1 Tax=Hydrogenophaga sp. TaxID=1904254 RepID=UPI0027316A60|nr:hypothetical protein [Hydrogenophaga sp.]MDP2405381.1 hypothetical protein [Hydrogenophaga sp.]MDZ4175400.1 hypothetical protein [Hydrogenophaga sp.]